MQKRGQTTLFILLGILILVGAFIFFYFQSIKQEQPISPETREIEEVPTDIMPVKAYVENCIGQVAERGIDLLMSQGGYIEPNFNVQYDVTEGEGIEFPPGIKVPYWYYMKSNNKCQNDCKFTDELMPPLCREGRQCIKSGDNSIEEQLDDYISLELNKCLRFSTFKPQGLAITGGLINDVDTTIRDKDITIKLNYPLTIEKENQKTEINKFQNIIASDLSEIYDIAYDITQYEAKNCFIGDHVRNFYGQYMSVDSNKLPPIYDVSTGSSNKISWSLQNVKMNIRTKTDSALQLLGIFNSSGFVWPEPTKQDRLEQREAIYNQFVFFPLRKYHDASVQMRYYQWMEPYLDIKPNEGGTLVPTELGGGAGPAQIIGLLSRTYIYEFFYQYSFPVIITITKKDNIGRQQIFRFALESNIRANDCFNPRAELVHSTSMSSPICDMDFRSENSTVEVKDEAGNPLQDVSISYFIGQSCPLATTDNEGKAEISYPDAFGAFMKFEKEDYVIKVIKQNDQNKFDKNIDITLDNYYHLNARMKKFPMELPNTWPHGTSQELDANDQVLFNIEKVPDASNPLEQDNKQTFLFNQSDIANDIKLTPGSYKIDINYFSEEPYDIPAKCYRICTDYDIFNDCEDWDYYPESPQPNQITFNTQINEETGGYWQVSKEMLEGKQDIEFYAIIPPKPNCIIGKEEMDGDGIKCEIDELGIPPYICIGLSEIGKSLNYSQNYRTFILPKLS